MTQTPQHNLDGAVLHCEDSYRRYFALLAAVCRMLTQVYQKAEAKPSHESSVIRQYLARFLATVEALRMKFAFRNGDCRPLLVDLSDSGFPNWVDIEGMGVDIVTRSEQLSRLTSNAALRGAALDAMLRDHQDPVELLGRISERTYFELLDPAQLFLPFIPGTLVPVKGRGGATRSYVFDWAIYDPVKNRPVVYIMTFEQDQDAEPLEHKGESYQALCDIVRQHSQSISEVGTLAMTIDEEQVIHPKVLKCLTIGPLCSPLITAGVAAGLGEQQRLTTDAVARFGAEDDVAVFIKDAVVVSERQVINRGIFSRREKVREIFLIPETNPEAYRDRASIVHRYLLLPHGVLQEVGADADDVIPGIRRAMLITYDKKKEVTLHGAPSTTTR